MLSPRSGRGPAYAAGHCHIFPDRLEITPGRLGGNPSGSEPELVLPVRDLYIEPPVEVHDAHLTNGRHFGVAIDRPPCPFLSLSCYRRSEREWLIAIIHQLTTADTFPF